MKTVKAYLILTTSAAALAVATPASAGGVTSPVSVIDSIDWSQLGPDYNFVNTPTNVSTSLGHIVTVSNTAGAQLVQVNQAPGGSFNGNFAPGTALLWTTPFTGASDITLNFATPVLGAGAQIQADFSGAFTAQITVNGNQTFTENSNANGSPIFIGWLGGPINTIEFTLTSAYLGTTNDFAIGKVEISPGPVPGAGVAGLGALALAALFARAPRLSACSPDPLRTSRRPHPAAVSL
jgi:hypothetical protein